MRYKLRWWRYRVYKWWHDQLPGWIANKLPRKVAYWATIRVGANATTGKYSNQVLPELLFMDALKRWELLYEQKQSKRSKTSTTGVSEESVVVQDVRSTDRSEGEAPTKPKVGKNEPGREQWY